MTVAGIGKMGLKEWALLIGLSVIWGGSFFFNKVAVGEMPPLTVVFGRVALGAMGLWILVYALGHRMPALGRTWGAFLVLGFMNNLVPFTLIVWGQSQIASGLASILNATTPLFAVFVAHIFTSDERMTPGKVSGVLLGLAGVAVLIGLDALQGFGLHILAQFALLGAALCYALSGVFGRRLRGTPTVVIATGQVTCSTLMTLPLILLVDQPWTLAMPSLGAWGAVLGLGLLCTSFAYLIFFRLLATVGATNLMLVTFLIPITAILLGSMFLDERLEIHQFAGMGLIFLALATIDGRPLRFIGSRFLRKKVELVPADVRVNPPQGKGE
jgi:drug/metabolite transporter (DMT)-like permease